MLLDFFLSKPCSIIYDASLSRMWRFGLCPLIVNVYSIDTNTIQAIPTKTRNAEEILDVTVSMLYTLTISGHKPNLHILDNEAS